MDLLSSSNIFPNSSNFEMSSDHNSSSRASPSSFYRILEKLGILRLITIPQFLDRGDQPAAYKALDLLTDELVTVYIFSRYTDSRITAKSIETIRSMDNTYTNKLLNVHITSDEIWLVMEYFNLGSLYTLKRVVGREFSEADISWICHSVLSAVFYLNTIDKFHGNIALDTILINSKGQIKLNILESRSCILSSEDKRQDSSLSNQSDFENSTIIKEDLKALALCVLEIIDEDIQTDLKFNSNFRYSNELKSFIETCLNADPMKAYELLNHPLIKKYRYNFYQTRKQFCQESLLQLEEYRRRVVLQGIEDSDMSDTKELGGLKNFDDNHASLEEWDNVLSQSNSRYTIKNIEEMRKGYQDDIRFPGSDSNITIIERPSFIFTEESRNFENSGSLSDLEKKLITFGHEENSPTHIGCALKYVRNNKGTGYEEYIPQVKFFPEFHNNRREHNEEAGNNYESLLTNHQEQKDLFSVGKREVKSLNNFEGHEFSDRDEAMLSRNVNQSSWKVGTSMRDQLDRKKNSKLKPYMSINESNYVVKHRQSTIIVGSTDIVESFESQTMQTESCTEDTNSPFSEFDIGDEKRANEVSNICVKRFIFGNEDELVPYVELKFRSPGTIKKRHDYNDQETSQKRETLVKKEQNGKIKYDDKTPKAKVKDFALEIQKGILEAEKEREISEIRSKYQRIYKEIEAANQGN